MSNLEALSELVDDHTIANNQTLVSMAAAPTPAPSQSVSPSLNPAATTFIPASHAAEPPIPPVSESGTSERKYQYLPLSASIHSPTAYRGILRSIWNNPSERRYRLPVSPLPPRALLVHPRILPLVDFSVVEWEMLAGFVLVAPVNALPFTEAAICEYCRGAPGSGTGRPVALDVKVREIREWLSTLHVGLDYPDTSLDLFMGEDTPVGVGVVSVAAMFAMVKELEARREDIEIDIEYSWAYQHEDDY